MILAKDLKVGDHIIYHDKDLKKDEEMIIRFINDTYCGLSRIGERSCFINHYKDSAIKKVI